jgi:hypothetical protein
VTRLVAAVLGLGLLAGCSGSPATRGSAAPGGGHTTTAVVASSTTSTTLVAAPSTTAVERCTASTSQISKVDTRAATGHALRVYAVRNSSGRPCRTTGSPAVTLRDSTGRTLATAGTGAGFILPDRPATAVMVAPGQSAFFGIESTSLCAGDDPGATSDTLQVVLPGDTAPAVVAEQIVVCSPPAIVASPLRATQDDITRR